MIVKRRALVVEAGFVASFEYDRRGVSPRLEIFTRDALTDRIRAALGDIGEVPGRRTVSCRRTARIIADSGCGTCSSGLELATETHGTSIEALQLEARAAVKA